MTPARFQAFGPRDLDRIPQLRALPSAVRTAMRLVTHVLPFRVNLYVLEELIDWTRIPDDPMFQLTFPQPGMLAPEHRRRLAALERSGDHEKLRAAARAIQRSLNPHPAGQREHNLPVLDGRPLPGLQHKYRETVLFFPAQGQTCHAYCSYCFRWPQFVALDDLTFAAREVDDLVAYVRRHPEVTNVLVTGGDPLIMRAPLLRRYVEPLLALPSLTSIRLGTKSVAYWPQRFVSDGDADDVLRLFERIVKGGKHLAVMAHYSHPRELSTPIAERALARIVATGAVVRCQAPVIRRVNDDAATWATLWRTQVRLGAVPYYQFIARDTGARRYFEVPLARAWRVFRDAYASVSGLARTVRGPSMSTTPGKIVVDGITRIAGHDVFALRFLQARDPAWVGRPFHAALDERAAWVDQLVPAFRERRFFFESERAPSPRVQLPVVTEAA